MASYHVASCMCVLAYYYIAVNHFKAIPTLHMHSNIAMATGFLPILLQCVGPLVDC